MEPRERRRASRRKIDLRVTRQTGVDDVALCVDDVSPTGIKLRRPQGVQQATPICNLEIHLVEGAMSTVIAGRQVWSSEDYEGFEFISPSFAQQMIIERLCGNL